MRRGFIRRPTGSGRVRGGHADRAGRLCRGLALCLLALLCLTGCGGPATAGSVAAPTGAPAAAGTAQAAGLRVVTSTSILADLARNVAGEHADVVAIAPAGADVEGYRPGPQETRRVAEADVLVENGLGLDAWAAELFRNAGRGDAIRVTLTDGLTPIETAGEGGNPHMWLDAELAKAYTVRLRDAFARADPAHADAYRANQAAYARQLDELDAWIKQQVATIPPARRKLVTFHDAFPYFARAYGFQLVGFISPDAEHEPSAAELAKLVRRVQAEHVPAVFGEAQFSPRLAQALAEEAGVKVVTDLYNDSLGNSPPLDTYIGVMHHNVDAIVGALRT